MFIWKLKTSSFPGTRRSRKSRATEKSCWTFLHGMAGSVDRTALSGNFSTEWPVRWTERLCQGTSPRNGRFGGRNGLDWELLHGMAGSVDRTALTGDFSTEWPVRWTERLCQGTSPRNAQTVDGTGLAGYLRENLAPKVRLKSRGRSL